MENDEQDRDTDETWSNEGIFEATLYEPSWITEIEDHGLLPIHSSQLDPLTALEEPLRLGWITEHVAELAAEQQAELMGPHVAQWRRFGRFQPEVARLEDERTRLSGDERDKVTRQWRDEQHEFDTFKRSPEFQAALRFRLEKERPIFERVMARPECDPTRNFAETWRHEMEALLVDSQTDEPCTSEDAGGTDCARSDQVCTAQSVTEATPEREQGRRTRSDKLKRAIFDAWSKGLPLDTSASEVFEFLSRSDDTGYVRGRDGDELQWENGSGTLSRTSLKALSNRLPGYREEYKKGR